MTSPLKVLLLFSFLFISIHVRAQIDDRVSSIDFVQAINGNKIEALFYYQNNWKILREMAVKKGYIHSFQLLETPATEEAPYDLMLITTYSNMEQYEKREEFFAELIKEKGALKLMNDKQSNEFRKVLYGKDLVRHWN